MNFKLKYVGTGERERGALRESIAELWLRALFFGTPVGVAPTGIGVGTSDYVPGKYSDYSDKFDYALIYNSRVVYVEVTGSPWTKKRSAERFGSARLAILPDKQKCAVEAWAAGVPVYYMVINEAEGEVRFLLPHKVERVARSGRWAAGEKDYLLVPWRREVFTTPDAFRRAALTQLGLARW